MPSIEPNDGSGEVDGAEKGGCAFVITGGDGAVLFEAGEEILDQMAPFVEVSVECARLDGVRSGGNHDVDAGFAERLHHALLRVIGFVGDQRARRLGQPSKQHVGSGKIVRLAGRQMETGWIAERVAGRVNFRAQPPFASAEAFGLRAPFFAPAACWWARTMVESIMAYSLSADAESFSKTRFQTPFWAHREWRR